MMNRSASGLNLAHQLRKSGMQGGGGLGSSGSSGENNGDRRLPGNVYRAKTSVSSKYDIIGFISSGTYGRVYKAREKPGPNSDPKALYAIKRFKPEREGDAQLQWTGLSQSAIREMALCSELSHPNIVHLAEIILEDKSVFMVFEYCEHDLLQIIHHHTQPRRLIPASMIKSILFQLLNGLFYLHTQAWVLHRDLKPANIMVTSGGHVRIGDLGLARLFYKPLQSLWTGDKVVVTIWYRSPDLLLGAKHYTPAIDMWAVGCIFAELLSLRPIFKGEETKMDSKKTVPFQRNQMGKIVEILGMPRRENWKGLVDMPEYMQLQTLSAAAAAAAAAAASSSSSRGNGGNNSNNNHHHHHHHHPTHSHSHNNSGSGLYSSTSNNNGGGGGGAGRSDRNKGSNLESWYNNILKSANYPPDKSPGPKGYQLLSELFEYDPDKRLTAEQALHHEYFRHTGSSTTNTATSTTSATGSTTTMMNDPNKGKIWVSNNCFEGLEEEYPARRVTTESNDIGTGSLPGSKRAAVGGGGGGGGGGDDSSILPPAAKRR